MSRRQSGPLALPSAPRERASRPARAAWCSLCTVLAGMADVLGVAWLPLVMAGGSVDIYILLPLGCWGLGRLPRAVRDYPPRWWRRYYEAAADPAED